MNAIVEDLRSTIVPKSDQLNADQLVGGPMVITITDVTTTSAADQPVVIHYQNDNGRPYKPCLTMRKVLILAWGHDGRKWIGQSMTLYNDPSVKFGGMDVGGIRISHLTGIAKDIHVSLTATKGKKAPHAIKRLDTGPELFEVLKAIAAANNKATMEAAKNLAGQLVIGRELAQAQEAYRARVAELRAGVPLVQRIQQCATLEALQLLSDEAENLPAGEERDAVMAALLKRDGELAAA